MVGAAGRCRTAYPQRSLIWHSHRASAVDQVHTWRSVPQSVSFTQLSLAVWQ
jgi:hypothetical protein